MNENTLRIDPDILALVGLYTRKALVGHGDKTVMWTGDDELKLRGLMEKLSSKFTATGNQSIPDKCQECNHRSCDCECCMQVNIEWLISKLGNASNLTWVNKIKQTKQAD